MNNKKAINNMTTAVIMTFVIAILFVTIIMVGSAGKMSSLVDGLLPGGKCPDTGKTAASYADDVERNLNANNKVLSLSIYHAFDSCFADSDAERANVSKAKIHNMFYDYYKPQIVNPYQEANYSKVIANYDIILNDVENTELEDYLKKKFFTQVFNSYHQEFDTRYKLAFDQYIPKDGYKEKCDWMESKFSKVPTDFNSNEEKSKYAAIKASVASCFVARGDELRMVTDIGTGRVTDITNYNRPRQIDEIIYLYQEAVQLEVPRISQTALDAIDSLAICSEAGGVCSSSVQAGQSARGGPSVGFADCTDAKPLCVVGVAVVT